MKSHRRRQIIKPRSRLSAAGGAARQALQRPAAADERAVDEDFLSDGGRTRCHLCHLRAKPRGQNHTHVMAGSVQEKKTGMPLALLKFSQLTFLVWSFTFAFAVFQFI